MVTGGADQLIKIWNIGANSGKLYDNIVIQLLLQVRNFDDCLVTQSYLKSLSKNKTKIDSSWFCICILHKDQTCKRPLILKFG
jgi:hypothetical protein